MAEQDGPRQWDAFISHASEDKGDFVRPLAQALGQLGAQIWYDEFSLKLGDSLSQSIDRGLANSRFGVVILSPAFMSKAWPKHELSGLVNRQIGGQAKIVPVWHKVEAGEVSAFSPTLADLLAVRTSDGDAADIALRILAVIRPDLYAAHPHAVLRAMADGSALRRLQAELVAVREELSEFQCPYCGSAMNSRIDAPIDEEQKDWDQVESFDCGYQRFAGGEQSLCPQDPDFPTFDDYEITCKQSGDNPDRWVCIASGKTRKARSLDLGWGRGETADAAKRDLADRYNKKAKHQS